MNKYHDKTYQYLKKMLRQFCRQRASPFVSVDFYPYIKDLKLQYICEKTNSVSPQDRLNCKVNVMSKKHNQPLK